MKSIKRKKWTAIAVSLVLLFGIAVSVPATAEAKTLTVKKTSVTLAVQADGVYKNWEGVSNVAQFVDAQGEYCFAYDTGKNVVVVRTKNGVPRKKTVTLKKKYSLFGSVACDSDGNYYMVTGRVNSDADTAKKTVFITKYDKNGKIIKTVGTGYYTSQPFRAGTCDIAINGNILAVNYARLGTDGHQRNSLFAINIDTMKEVSLNNLSDSHSFAQRIIAYGDGFVSASEGDAYPRAFSVTISNPSAQTSTRSEIFHFWIKEGCSSNMYVVNNNFAHMGGITVVNDKLVALVGTSAKALNSKAESQNEQLFIQIFNPTQDLSDQSSYKTTGKRTGLSGIRGTQEVTDYGVKWLTSYDSNTQIANPQVVSDGDGKIVILFEKYVDSSYKGVYYMAVNKKGKIVKKETLLSATAQLNPCRMPVYSNGKVYWTANQYGDSTNALYVYSMDYIR